MMTYLSGLMNTHWPNEVRNRPSRSRAAASAGLSVTASM